MTDNQKQELIVRQNTLSRAVEFHKEFGFPQEGLELKDKLMQCTKTAEFFKNYVFYGPIKEATQEPKEKSIMRSIPSTLAPFPMKQMDSLIGIIRAGEYDRVRSALSTYFFSDEQMDMLAQEPNFKNLGL